MPETMRMYDIITKKKHGESLTDAEIRFFTEGYTRGEIPDYQISALLMAILLQGMDERETFTLTDAVARSGDMLDLSEFGERSVDKHSTGGVGDKTSLIVAPIVASLGAKVAKMSGRGLGHTGGTVDKLESFSAYRTSLSPEEFRAQVRKIGIAIIGQSGNLAPADKKLYALRDVTATVDSIPLITSSIMGKKLAAGSHAIVLDVKCGSGAFMNTPEAAEELARGMVRIGKSAGRKVAALITNMDRPLGYAVGNILEVREAIDVLRGEGPEDLREVCRALASAMAHLSLGVPLDEARARVDEALASGGAYRKFIEWIGEQSFGDVRSIALAKNPENFPVARYTLDVTAQERGYILAINAEAVGLAGVVLGAGRATKEDAIDFTAGILLRKKPGDKVAPGEVIATLFSNRKEALPLAAETVRGAVRYTDQKPADLPLIYRVISSEEE